MNHEVLEFFEKSFVQKLNFPFYREAMSTKSNRFEATPAEGRPQSDAAVPWLADWYSLKSTKPSIDHSFLSAERVFENNCHMQKLISISAEFLQKSYRTIECFQLVN